MTIEELEKQVSDLQAEKEAMNAKNKELLGEVKKLKAKKRWWLLMPEKRRTAKDKSKFEKPR